MEDSKNPRLFDGVRTTDDFYLTLASYTSTPLGNSSNTLI